jgi:hypothetical protein
MGFKPKTFRLAMVAYGLATAIGPAKEVPIHPTIKPMINQAIFLHVVIRMLSSGPPVKSAALSSSTP